MASTRKCRICGETILSSQVKCPLCGAPNDAFIVDFPEFITNPETIEQLQEYCAERGMPLLKMRFFIGEDFPEPKAFGIFQALDGDYVVYKNKADGSRAIRYKGGDQAYAVHEILQKLREECAARGIDPDAKLKKAGDSKETADEAPVKPVYGPIGSWYSQHLLGTVWEKIFVGLLILAVSVLFIIPALLVFVAPLVLIPWGIYKIAHKKWKIKGILIWLAVTLAACALAGGTIYNIVTDRSYSEGYYVHDDAVYYLYDDYWYMPDGDDWVPAEDEDLYDAVSEAEYCAEGYSEDWNVGQFTDTELYGELSAQRYEDSDWGSDDDSWDSSYDSWDSDSTSWDSDW